MKPPATTDELRMVAPTTESEAAEMSWWQGINRYQWLVLLVAFLGLMFDLMNANLLGLSIAPALRELLGAKASTQNVGWYGGIITAIFLAGWALGSMLFGVFADYYGRKPALVVTFLVYSLFTGLAVISHTWWDFAIYRFITALSIGGEWAAGIALVSETWPERSRVKAIIAVQSASGFGGVVAGAINILIGTYSWRYIFLVGALPGLLLLGLCWRVRESDRWLAVREGLKTAAKSAKKRSKAVSVEQQKASQSSDFTLRQIFSKQLRRDTIVAASLATIVTVGYWGVGWFVPTMLSELLTQGTRQVPHATVIRYVSYSQMLLSGGSLGAYGTFLLMGPLWRRKKAFLIFFLGSFITTMSVLFFHSSLFTFMMLLPVMGLFILGVWVVFPVYLAELYPTRLRGTGAGFAFTTGRTLAAVASTMTGTLVAYTGSFVTALSILTCVYLLGPITLLFARETRGKALE